jgi:predicted RNase H-like HicB family nuclease
MANNLSRCITPSIMNRYVFHGIIEKVDDVYCALCLELDIATEADTLEEAKKNLREAVEGYVESVVRDGEESDFIPRPVPEEVIQEYESRFKRYLNSFSPVELYGYSEIVDAQIPQAVE